MAGLIPFNKNREVARMDPIEDFYNMLDDFFSDTWTPKRSLLSDTFKVDVQEKDKEYYIEAELPGVKKEEVDVELNDGRLTVSVSRDEKVDEEKKNYIHKERRYCSMQRSIYLGDAKAEGVKAKLNNGVLSVTVPKDEKADNTLKIKVD